MKIEKNIYFINISSRCFASCNNDLLEPFTPGSLTEEVAITNPTDLKIDELYVWSTNQ
jgi:hypothetical protein